MKKLSIVVFCAALFAMTTATSAAQEPDYRKLAREVLKEVIEINSGDATGSVTAVSEVLARRFRAGGFAEQDVIFDGPSEKKKNLVIRIHGSGKKKPILFIGHLDVVEARREDWTTDPFQLVEKDGYFYGRGTADVKGADTLLIVNFLRLKKEGYTPDRDLILALTADEEVGAANGVDWLLSKHRDWIDAAYCINVDSGEFEKDNGQPRLAFIQAAEKLYVDYRVETRNIGGHSSKPIRDNAIYELADALLRVREFAFPAKLTEINKTYFSKMAFFESGQTAADMKAVERGGDAVEGAVMRLSAQSPIYNALFRTTCVATMLEGGHSPNALPQLAAANVNCRIFPGEDPEEVRAALEKTIGDKKVQVSIAPFTSPDGTVQRQTASPASPLLPEVVKAEEKVVQQLFPGTPVIPMLEVGATDGLYLRKAGIPTYGISGIFYESEDLRRAHGKDERVGAKDFFAGLEFNYRLIRELGGEN